MRRLQQRWRLVALVLVIALGLTAAMSGMMARGGSSGCCGCCSPLQTSAQCGALMSDLASPSHAGCPLCASPAGVSTNRVMASSSIAPMHGCTHDCCGDGGSDPGREPRLPSRSAGSESKLAFGPASRFFSLAPGALAAHAPMTAGFSRPVIVASGSSRLAIFGRRNT